MTGKKRSKLMRNSLVLLTLFFLSSCSYFNSSKLINGSPAPAFSLPDKNGQPLALSSFKGDLVLVEFWASWCKPCREENPKIVKLYNKYKDSAFQQANRLQVVSISLDTDKEKWLDAVRQDNLIWEHHLNDLQGWNGAAVDSYRVESIPSSFLVDQNGIIIGKNLKARDLDKLLAALAKP